MVDANEALGIDSNSSVIDANEALSIEDQTSIEDQLSIEDQNSMEPLLSTPSSVDTIDGIDTNSIENQQLEIQFIYHQLLLLLALLIEQVSQCSKLE